MNSQFNSPSNRPKSFRQEEQEKKEMKMKEYKKLMGVLSVRNQNKCSKCRAEVVMDHKGGRVICTSCGVIKEDRFIESGSEYRYFIENTSMRNDPRRVGNSVNMHMDSQIDLIEIDNGKRNFHTFANQSNTDKMFNRATKIIKRFCDQLHLKNNIIKQIEDMYYQILNQKELKGKKLEIIVSGCIYLVCKRNYVNLHPADLEPLADKNYKKILKVSKTISKYIPAINVDAHNYVKMYGKELSLNSRDIEIMVLICLEIKKFNFFKNKQPKPRSVAASVMNFYLQNFSDDKKSLNQIKQVSRISTDATITSYQKNFDCHREFITNLVNKAKSSKKVKTNND